jgi:hypothetical protein
MNGSYIFHNCPVKTIKINCNKELDSNNNNIIQTLDDLSSGGRGYCPTAYIDTLHVALSPSILKKSPEDLLTYVTKILELNPPYNNIIYAIKTNSGTFELDLSNTTLQKSVIENLENPLQWKIIYS